MKLKKERRLCGIGLLLVGLSALVFTGAGLLGVQLPDALRGGLGIIDLLATPVVVYTAFKIAGNETN